MHLHFTSFQFIILKMYKHVTYSGNLSRILLISQECGVQSRLSVYLSVCNALTFESLDLENSF